MDHSMDILITMETFSTNITFNLLQFFQNFTIQCYVWFVYALHGNQLAFVQSETKRTNFVEEFHIQHIISLSFPSVSLSFVSAAFVFSLLFLHLFQNYFRNLEVPSDWFAASNWLWNPSKKSIIHPKLRSKSIKGSKNFYNYQIHSNFNDAFL